MRRIYLLGLTVTTLVSGPIFAQDPDVMAKKTDVFVQLKGAASNRRISVGPRAVAVCKKETVICDNRITWKWLPPKGKEGESILVKFDSPEASKCFDHTSLPIALTNGTVTATVKDDAACHTKTAWFYTVSCVNAEGVSCDGVEAIDPGVVIDGSG
jgi:hypothetical protein